LILIVPALPAPVTTGSVSPVSLTEASRFWLQLGLVSFGGPAGQIALLHRELVERRRWLSERRYLHALNYCMLLPGPEATQLATYLGWLMHGTRGGLIAGGLFLAPSVLVLTALATGYALWGQLPLLAAVFAVLKPAVLAIVLVAAWRVGRRALRTPLLLGIAAAAFLALAVLRLPYPLVVVGAAVSGWGVGRWRPGLLLAPERAHDSGAQQEATAAVLPERASTAGPIHGDDTPTPAHCRFSRRRLALTMLAWGLGVLIPLALLSALGGWNGTLALMARFFTRVALLSFGGAYAVLPYVAQGAVEQFDWLSATQMLDGLALGETTPGPLIMVVAFVGFMGGWNQGLGAGLGAGSWPVAVAATLVTVWFTFLPSFGFILAGAPLVEASRDDLRLGAPLTAITAAVVGVIASLAVFFAGPVLWPAGSFNPGALVVVAAALFAQLQLRWSVLQVIGLAAVVGAASAGVVQLLG
jgi:chromate transporter